MSSSVSSPIPSINMPIVWIILCKLILTVSPAPNFVFIVADDLGFNDVGWKQSTNTYTPILDSLKANALEINRFYVYSSCSPTRAALWTGRYTHMIGMQDTGITSTFSCGVEPAPNTVFFTEKLKQCGSYKNYFLGKWHLGMYKWEHTPIFRGGLDYFKGNLGSAIDYTTFTSPSQNVYDWRENTNKYTSTSDTYTTTAIGNKAVEIINTISTNNDISPFTLMISFTAPHGPLHESPDHTDAVQNGIYTATGALERQQYNGMIRTMDIQINEIITALKTKHVNNLPIWDNTYAFFFSDNGAMSTHGSNYPLRGTKETYFEGGIRVPAFITGGALHSSLQGTSYDKPIHVTDIYATLMELANVDTSALTLDGSSFASILNPTQTSLTRDTIIISVNNVACSTTYVYNSDQVYVCGGIIKQTDNTHIYKLVIGSVIAGRGAKYGWVHLDNQNELNDSITNCGSIPQPIFNYAFKNTDCANTGQPCLYNLYADPCEYTNLATDSTYASILSTLMSDLIDAYDSQVTPLLQTGTCTQHSSTTISTYWNTNAQLMPFAHFEDASFTKANAANYTASGVCTFSPTKNPSKSPITKSSSNNPTKPPTHNPTKHPTLNPTTIPTNVPTKSPSHNPTTNLSVAPTKIPSKNPASNPNITPTKNPTNNPSKSPTNNPTNSPSKFPTHFPSNHPSVSPISNTVIFETTPTRRWIPANDACADNLVSIKTEGYKNEIATYLTSRIPEAWIGLKSISGTFQWTDGTECDATCTSFWGNGQPGSHNCVVINSAGKFATKPCQIKKAHFCAASGSASGSALHNDKRQSETNYSLKAYGNDANDEKEDNEKYIYYVYTMILFISLLIIITVIIVGCIYIKRQSVKVSFNT